MNHETKVRQTSKTVFLIVFTILYNFFFWKEQLGINLLIFSTLLIASMLIWLFPASIKRQNVKVSLCLTLCTLAMVCYHNTFISKFSFVFSFMFLIGFIQQNNLITVLGAFERYVLNFFYSIKDFFNFLNTQIEGLIGENRYSRFIFRNLPLMIIPTIFFGIFFIIFASSNPVFREMLDSLGAFIGQYLKQIFVNISFGRIVFIIIGIYLIFSILNGSERVKSLFKNISKSDNIDASEIDFSENIKAKNEFKMALMLIVSVNVILLVINVIDINYLWLNFDYSTAGNLSKLVHEGTYSLIFSILLSMAILLYFFRRDLNFYPQRKLLKFAAFVWIIQNIILAISVCIRNSYYVGFYGLTHKRIGVAIFLLLTVIGLCVLYLKIRQNKSFYYLLKTNTWAWYFVLVGLSFVNWDLQIARFNLANQATEKIDWNYLLELSDKTLPVFYDYHNKLTTNEPIIMRLDSKRLNYLENQKKYSWLSWNWADYQAVTRLNALNNHSIKSN